MDKNVTEHNQSDDLIITHGNQPGNDQKMILHELELVNRVILKINQERNIDIMAEILAKAVYEVNPGSQVVVSIYDEDIGSVKIRSIIGLDKNLKKIAGIFGKDPLKIKFDPLKLDKVYTNYTSGKLLPVKGGLSELMAGQMPSVQCRMAEKFMNVESVYTAGFASSEMAKGGIIIFLKKGKKINFTSAIETLIAQISQVIQKRQAEDKEKILHRNIEFLSKTAMQFVKFPPDNNIYDFVGEQVRELTGKDSYIVVNSVDFKTGFSTIKSFLGVGKFEKIITGKLGRHLVGMKLEVEDLNEHYPDGRVHIYQEGLYGLLLKTVSKSICKSIEKLTNVDKIYVIDLVNQEKFFGNIIIFSKEETGELKNKLLIETFIKQASIAILKKQAVDELRINEVKSNLIINTSPLGICTVDILGNFITTNLAYERMLGYSKEELVGLSFFDITHPNDRPKNKKLFKEMFSLDSAGFSIEKRYIRKDSKEIQVSVKAIGISDSEGIIKFGTAFVEDITERTLAEQKISLSSNRYMALFNESPIPLWEEDFTDLLAYLLIIKEKGNKDLSNYFDNNTDELKKCAGMVKILDVNQAALDLHLAKNKEQLIGNLSRTFTANSYSIFKEELISLIEGKEIYENEAEVKTLSGDLKQISIKLKFDYSQADKVTALLATTDITDQKQAAKNLLDSEEKFRGIFEQSPIAIEIYNVDGKLIDVNRHSMEMFGVDDKKHILGFILWENPHYSSENLEDLKNGKSVFISTSFNFEIIKSKKFYPTKRSGIIDVDIYAIPLMKKEEVTGYLIQIMEVTDRKQAEEALLVNQRRYKEAQEIGHVGNWEYDPVTSFFWASDEARKIYGFEIEGKDLTTEEVESCIFEKKRVHQALIDLIKQNRKYDLVYDIITKNKGIRKTVNSIAKIERDALGNPFKISGVVSDISERKNAEEAIRKQKNMFELVINSVPSRIFWKDLDLAYLGCNMSFLKAVEKNKPDDIIGKNDFDLIWAKEAEKFNNDDREVIKKGIPKLGYEEFYILPDGKKIWWQTSKMPLKDNTGKIIGLLATSEDVTKRRQAEDKNSKQLNELRRWHTAMLDREEKVLELKKEVNVLLAHAGMPLRYTSVVSADSQIP